MTVYQLTLANCCQLLGTVVCLHDMHSDRGNVSMRCSTVRVYVQTMLAMYSSDEP